MSIQSRIVPISGGGMGCVTIDGDMVDEIAHAYFGKHERYTEEILALNPGLSDRGPRLPAGLVIRLPETQTTQVSTQSSVKLWD